MAVGGLARMAVAIPGVWDERASGTVVWVKGRKACCRRLRRKIDGEKGIIAVLRLLTLIYCHEKTTLRWIIRHVLNAVGGISRVYEYFVERSLRTCLIELAEADWLGKLVQFLEESMALLYVVTNASMEERVVSLTSSSFSSVSEP